jgi:hypothetical protein
MGISFSFDLMFRDKRSKFRSWIVLLFLIIFLPKVHAVSTEDSLGFPGNWDAFPSHIEYLQFMLDLRETYPDICFLDTIGLSVQGRPIMVMKISDSLNLREPEPVFYYSSTMHGDETSGFMLMLRLMDHLCRNYGQDELCTRLVDNVEIWINPLANPDGTYRDNDSIILNPTRNNSNGVNLNRNFPSQVGGTVIHEPETRDQMKFMDSLHLVLSANIHDGAEVFNYPWDYWSRLHPDDNWYIWAGRKYVDTVYERKYPVTGYFSGFDEGITNGYAWYDITGGRQDYTNYFLHAREITLEINDNKFPNAGDLEFLWHANHPSLLQYIENSLFGIQGIVTDSLTGQPVKAMISVLDHDMDESHIFSDSISGYFARLIEPGSWNFEFYAEGYNTKTIPIELLQWDIPLNISVMMDPVASGNYSVNKLEAWPNPWIRESNIRFHTNIPGNRQIILTGLDGRIILREIISCPVTGTYEYKLTGTNIQPGWYLLQLISIEGISSVKLLKSQ